MNSESDGESSNATSEDIYSKIFDRNISESSDVETTIELKTIDDLIRGINLQIEFNFSKNDCNQESIVESFSEINKRIEDLLKINPVYYDYYKYQYHIKYSSFLRVIGNEYLAKDHEKLSKKYEESYIKTCANNNRQSEINNNEISLDNNFSNYNDDFYDEDGIFSKIESFDFIELKFVETIKNELNQINRVKLNNFTEYKSLQLSSVNLEKIIDEIILKLNTSNRSMSQLREHLVELRLIVEKKIYKIKIDFMQKVVVSTKPENLLYNELIATTGDNVNRCYRKLMLYFHPDKWPGDVNEALVRNVAEVIISLKETFLESFEINRAEEIGNELRQKSFDVEFAINNQLGKMKYLNKFNLENLTEEELKALKTKYIIESFEYYKNACKIADRLHIIDKQIELRGTMSLLLFDAGEYFEAPLYAIGSIKLIFQHSNI